MKAALAMLLAIPLVLGWICFDARSRRTDRAADEKAISAVARRLPSSDLALSGGARWLRNPSLEEPAAAFADGPALPDPDPAGGVMSPPRAIWNAEVKR